MGKKLWLLLVIMITGICFNGVLAQSERAAVLTVIAPGVEFQRTNTDQWFSLPAGAIAPMGNGDRIRTDDVGRAMIDFGQDSQALILPESDYRIQMYAEADEFSWSAELTGFAVHQIDPTLGQFELVAADVTITSAVGRLATWTTDLQQPTLIVAQGQATVEPDVTVQAGEGFRPGYDQAVEITADLLSEARLISQVAGCPGLVDTIDDENLLVRSGSAIDAPDMGAIPNGEAVALLGVSENDLRYRVQYLSDFGWVEALAIETDCTDLPVFPVPYQEFFRIIIDVTDDEADLLAPFYGPPFEDPWFYRFTSLPSGGG
jgi:hypothetical protein